ncbi:MAG: hypothetical protein IKN04_07985 [Clostridia bacterium]|nr:hypothetical protein [Clostridia bacterium]
MKHDWLKIKTYYMRGGASLCQTALKYGIPESTLYARACREKWVAERQESGKKALARAQARAQESKARQIETDLERVYELLGAVLGRLEAAAADKYQFQRWLVNVGPGKQEEKVLKKVDTKQVRELLDCADAIRAIIKPPEEEIEKQEPVKLTLEVEKVHGDQDQAEHETV